MISQDFFNLYESHTRGQSLVMNVGIRGKRSLGSGRERGTLGDKTFIVSNVPVIDKFEIVIIDQHLPLLGKSFIGSKVLTFYPFQFDKVQLKLPCGLIIRK